MFNSTLANEITSYLEMRKMTYHSFLLSYDQCILLSLDRYLSQPEFVGKNLTETVLSAWEKTLSGKSKTVKEKLIEIRGFVKYLNTLGFSSYLPDLPKVKSDYIPYIFSDREIASIFHYADNIEHPATSKGYKTNYYLKIPMILRILYSCGTRLTETLELRRKDIDFKNKTIFLKHTKFAKERLIPIHESLNSILEHYCMALEIMNEPDAFLFPGRSPNAHYTKRQVEHWFAEILKQAGIDQRDRTRYERGACLHCFRHLFVLKSMQQLETSGHSVDINDLLLPTYLGHVCLLDTDQYMRFSGAQLPESLADFETFTAGVIPQIKEVYNENQD